MCGIVGAIVLGEGDGRFQVRAPYIDRMRDTMVHRGPDGAGTWVAPDGRLGLGHRRLSIIDLSTAAAQPMPNEDGALQITFNGEIYNHAEIRRELVARGGHTWRTDHSDTEMILHAFEEWGIDCLHRFRGMFAFGLWDGRRRELWLVRDRMGVKPLYYSIHHGRLVFASEIKALLADGEQARAVNEEGLFDYLTFLTTPAPDTLFQGIKKLPAGCLLRVDAQGRVEERRWYELWDHVTPLTGLSEAQITERLMAELRTAVQLRKVSDVPVGVFLSGGVDSSTNAALFSEGEASRVKTFSVGYDAEYDSYRSELPFARMMAERVGAEHHEILLSQRDALDFMPRMVQLQDEPLGDPVCIPVYFVSKLAREHGVIVCQVGEGADELFWGYAGWKKQLEAQRLVDRWTVPALCRLGVAGLDVLGRSDGWLRELLRRAGQGQPTFWAGADAFPDGRKRGLLSPRLREAFRDRTSWDALAPIHARWLAGRWEPDILNWMTYSDLNVRLPELLLMRVDKMSMGVSLEGRVPFLDHKFVELAMGIPARLKTAGGESKRVLKRAVRGLIPDAIIDRPKQGFGVPVHEWYFDRLGDESRETFRQFQRATDLFDGERIQQMHGEGVGYRLWHLLNVALWWREYIAAPAPASRAG
ncbi:MAG: asparagine synthase (glutamine-hydrolyzing) [Gemmatimonadales bacterium]|nr:asparagine synthase (glutamine-hydrolyzing) [Gemmatimonadales bacterium]